MRIRTGRPALLVGAFVLAGALAVPVLGQELSPSPSEEASPSASEEASPSASESPSDPVASTAPTDVPATAEPTAAPTALSPAPASPVAPASDEPAEDKDLGDEAETPVTLTGVVRADTTGEHPSYTLTVGSTTYELEVGPPWFWGDKHPLAAYVGKTVTVQGQQEGTTSIEVFTAGGTTIREAGKPPWAGGPKVVGERHPGWKPWKADKWADGKPGNGPRDPATTSGAADGSDAGRDP